MITALPTDIFPEADAAGEDFSREEEAEALVKAYFSIAKEWELNPGQAQALLGHPGKSRFYDLRKGVVRAVHGISEDEIDRLAYLSGIYYGLGILFSPENTRAWLCNKPDPAHAYTRPWGAVAPLEYMLSGKMEALIDVYRYVNGMRGAL